MILRSAFFKAAMLVSGIGMSVSAPAQNAPEKDKLPDSITIAMPSAKAENPATGKPDSYVIPHYAEYTNKIQGSGTKNFDFYQRYTYIHINKTHSSGHIRLRNVITPAITTHKASDDSAKTTYESGGLYFAHGYDKFDEKDIVRPTDYQNVDLGKIAQELIKNESIELKMTGHADTSGDADKNQTLSENRIETSKKLLLQALQDHGLTYDAALDLYDTRVAPNTTIVAHGESNGPVSTSDGIKEQGNRVVTFDLVSTAKFFSAFTAKMKKVADFDNHEHAVVLRIGPETTQKDISFYPHYHENSTQNQISIPDENTNFIIKIDPARQKPFTIKHYAQDNTIADNTNFLIENSTPGAVTNAYNFDTGNIDISVDGKVMISINNTNSKVDPAQIRIGQVDTDGNATIIPMSNLDDVAPISEARSTLTERTVLTEAADKIVHLSIDAKHMYMKHKDDQAAYLSALEHYGFRDKLHDALRDVQGAGIDTGAYEKFLVNSYTNPKVNYFSPDQIVFPFQTYQGLHQSQPAQMTEAKSNPQIAYSELMKTIKRNGGKATPNTMPAKTFVWSPD